MAGYNQKIVRTNSYVEIREYEKPIFIQDKFIEVSEPVIEKEQKNLNVKRLMNSPRKNKTRD